MMRDALGNYGARYKFKCTCVCGLFEFRIMTRGNFASTIPGMDVPCCLVSLMSSGRRPDDATVVL